MSDAHQLALAEALKRCENEPIQFIDSIQSHGVLLALENQRVVSVSANLGNVVTCTATDALGKNVVDVLGAEAWARIVSLPIGDELLSSLPVALPLRFEDRVVVRAAQVHRVQGKTVIEIESATGTDLPPGQLTDFNSTAVLFQSLLTESVALPTLLNQLAEKIHDLTGFDRVLVYRFDAEWNGEVVAESRNEVLPSFLGHCFPAADIPAPARELYARNRVRMLADRTAPPVPLLYPMAERTLDLSFAALRSMSPIHLTYLKNMDVAASLSVSILERGRLWGLVVAHHRTPRRTPLMLRQTLEFIGRIASNRLSAMAYERSLAYQARLRELFTRLMDPVAGKPDLADADHPLVANILSVAGASGVLISLASERIALGSVPGEPQIDGLLDWLSSRLGPGKYLATHTLVADYPPAQAFAGCASGLLAVQLNDGGRQHLLWFREEVVREIPWAGDARKHLSEDLRGPRLEPRQSFERWVDIHRGTSYPWSEAEIDATRTLSLVMVNLITDQKLRRAEDAARLAALVYEHSSEAMMVVDSDNRIIAVNRAFTTITGYLAEEALGQTPRLLRSGRQDKDFYAAMWQEIITTGAWHGEIWNRGKSGEMFAELLTINTIFGEHNQVLLRVALFQDVTQRIRATEEIHQHAFFDPLTKLPNRRLFFDRLNQEVIKALRSGESSALLFIDLDRFKDVNEALGHARGDQLLMEATARIRSCLRETDTLARLGGDEFAVMLDSVGEAGNVDLISQRIIQLLSEPINFSEGEILTSASIGIALIPNDADNAEDLLKQAEQAMYVAKGAGRSRYRYFAPYMQEAAQVRRRVTTDLRHALQENQLLVHYQPIVELTTGNICKAEALVRWQHPEHGLISPAAFIPIAEETGMIVEIGDWVFEQAARQALDWQVRFDARFQISVNKSPVQFRNEVRAHHQWLEFMADIGLPTKGIVVEITEGVLMETSEDIMGKLVSIRDNGMPLSLDDFGTGYSSLSYLHKFTIDYLKIDQSFVRTMVPCSKEQALCEAIIVMAHKLNIKVIAEGIETDLQRNLLLAAGCDFGQGYLFSKPVPATQFEILLAVPKN